MVLLSGLSDPPCGPIMTESTRPSMKGNISPMCPTINARFGYRSKTPAKAAPCNAAATALAYHYERFSPLMLLDQLARWKVTTFRAPPTVWRMLVQQDLARWRLAFRRIYDLVFVAG